VSASTVSNGNVISAIYHLGDRHQRTWPTAADIARHLKADESQVLTCLRDLRAQRLMRDRRRKGQRVWMPWEEA
jgi:hypothetical protein